MTLVGSRTEYLRDLMFNVSRYIIIAMIQTFHCKHTEALYEGGNPRQFQAFQAQAQRKLEMLDAARIIEDLRDPPGTGWRS